MRLLRIFALIALCLALMPAPAIAVTGYDSSYNSESAFVMITPGETKSFQVFFMNTGTVTWIKGSSSQVDLAACREDKVTCNAQDASEATWNAGWLSTGRYATTTQATVGPGSVATFAYNIKAPADATGTHRFNGDLVLSATGDRIHPEGYYQDATVEAIGNIPLPTPTPAPVVVLPPRTPRPTPTPTPLGTLTVNEAATATGCPGENFVTTFAGSGLAASTTYQLTRTRTAPPPVQTGTLAEVTTETDGTFILGVTTDGAIAPSTYTVVVTLEGTPKTNSVQVTFVCNVLRAEPWEFDPNVTDTVTATWQADNTLLLSKQTDTSTNSSAGAEITVNHEHFTGTVTELGFEFSDESWCGAGAPRFNVYTSADFTDYWAFGCNAGTKTELTGGWTRVRFDLATDGYHLSAGGAQEPLLLPATALEIVFDEGTDVGPGSAILDNIDVNGVIITNSAGTVLP